MEQSDEESEISGSEQSNQDSSQESDQESAEPFFETETELTLSNQEVRAEATKQASNVYKYLENTELKSIEPVYFQKVRRLFEVYQEIIASSDEYIENESFLHLRETLILLMRTSFISNMMIDNDRDLVEMTDDIFDFVYESITNVGFETMLEEFDSFLQVLESDEEDGEEEVGDDDEDEDDSEQGDQEEDEDEDYEEEAQGDEDSEGAIMES